jgi:hypothetical protein
MGITTSQAEAVEISEEEKKLLTLQKIARKTTLPFCPSPQKGTFLD